MSTHKSLKKNLQKKKVFKDKPFIDNNLQIQIPELDQLRVAGNRNFLDSLTNKQTMQNELNQIEKNLQVAIDEAKQAHASWKKLQTKLVELTGKVKS